MAGIEEIEESPADNISNEEKHINFEESSQEGKTASQPKQEHPILEESVEDEKAEGISENEVVASEKKNLSSEAKERKPKAVSKQNLKAKPTVSQPFQLATEKRMSRERRGGIDLSKPSKPKLPKSTSLSPSLKVPSQSSAKTARSYSVIERRKERVENQILSGNKRDEKVHVNEALIKKPGVKVSSIQSQESNQQSEVKKLKKSSTFKATPLPSFYHQKTPAKPEIKKIPTSRAKSPVVGHHRSKSMSESIGIKANARNAAASSTTATTKKNNTTQTSEAGRAAKEETSVTMKSSPKTISRSAKETLNRLLKGSWKTPVDKRKDSTKEEPCSGRLQKEGEVLVS